VTQHVAVSVVIASGGYQGIHHGKPISGIADAQAIEGVTVYMRARSSLLTVRWSRLAACPERDRGRARLRDRDRDRLPSVGRISFDGAFYELTSHTGTGFRQPGA